jgi:hypothetical protein
LCVEGAHLNRHSGNRVALFGLYASTDAESFVEISLDSDWGCAYGNAFFVIEGARTTRGQHVLPRPDPIEGYVARV